MKVMKQSNFKASTSFKEKKAPGKRISKPLSKKELLKKILIEDENQSAIMPDVGSTNSSDENYKIICYGNLAQLAYTLGETKVAILLERIFAKEKETDNALTVFNNYKKPQEEHLKNIDS